MKRKHLLRAGALLALMFGSLQCFADDIMVVQPIDGGEAIESSLASIAKITFGADAMTIETASGSIDVPYLKVQSIKFKDDGFVGISTLVGDKSILKVRYAKEQLIISGVDDAVDVAIFSLGGNVMLAEPECTAHTIDVSRLTPGVYIAKVNDVVVKFAK